MLGHNFYHGLTKKYVALFGTLFNDIVITRVDENGKTLQSMKVPILYAPRDKMLARLRDNPSLNRDAAVTLPRMSFTISGIQYDNTRKLTKTGRNINRSDKTNAPRTQFNPVSYNIAFTLYIYAKTAEDATKIVEQILPFFTPDWTVTAELIPEMNIVMDVPIFLRDVTYDDAYEGDYSERRTIIWTLNFDMYVNYYGPVRESKIIKLANTNFFATSTDDFSEYEKDITVNIQPGLLANGSPTSNSSLTVPLDQIGANDNYGYIITKLE